MKHCEANTTKSVKKHGFTHTKRGPQLLRKENPHPNQYHQQNYHQNYQNHKEIPQQNTGIHNYHDQLSRPRMRQVEPHQYNQFH
jgi:hypothetical protein